MPRTTIDIEALILRAARPRRWPRSSTRSSTPLAELGVEYIELPATPERAWRAIRAARG